MPGFPIIDAVRPAEGSSQADPLFRALAAFAEARSEPQMLDLLNEIAASHFGAAGAVLVSCEPALVSAHRIARLAGGAISPGVQVCHPTVEARMKGGAAVVSNAPQTDLPGILVSPGVHCAVLAPCSGEGSTSAVCAFWTTDAKRPTPCDLDRLCLLAAMVGLAFDRQISDLRDRILRSDLDNRIRNVLAVIRSVGTRSAERAASMEDFLLHYEGRIDAIGRSQIASTRHGGISLELLLREELFAQSIQDEAHVSLDGIDVAVTSEQAEALGLAIHELAVNALKFGALAGPGGSLTVRWWVESGAESLELNIDWRERCGVLPARGRPDRVGFGLAYIEHALPFQLNADVTLGFAREGLRCQIALPLQRARPARGVFTGLPAPLGPHLPAEIPWCAGRTDDFRCETDLLRK